MEMQEPKAIQVLKSLQSHLGASRESIEHDEDYVKQWDSIDEAIKEIAALLSPRTCNGCVNEQYGSYFECDTCVRHIIKFRANFVDRYKPNTTPC